MDEIVKQAMAKWPKVPHCYGWLALDARGHWRMRDERAQALNLPGDKIANAALIGFINRNYLHDEQGRWYFQNGPQRVYVSLEATPYIAHTDPMQGWVLHTGELIATLDAAWMTESGQLLLKSGEKIALVDDRDMAHCLAQLRMDQINVSDDELLAWLTNASDKNQLSLLDRNKSIPVLRIESDKLASTFGYVAVPAPATRTAGSHARSE
jgi:hypothetical protein